MTVDDAELARIGPGLVVLVGVGTEDGDEQARALARKVANLRMFSDEAGRFNLSALDVGAELLVVSQFTLYADTRAGRRPGFEQAARPEVAEPLVGRFVSYLREAGLSVRTGRFGAHMRVALVNDGPVTIVLEI